LEIEPGLPLRDAILPRRQALTCLREGPFCRGTTPPPRSAQRRTGRDRRAACRAGERASAIHRLIAGSRNQRAKRQAEGDCERRVVASSDAWRNRAQPSCSGSSRHVWHKMVSLLGNSSGSCERLSATAGLSVHPRSGAVRAAAARDAFDAQRLAAAVESIGFAC